MVANGEPPPMHLLGGQEWPREFKTPLRLQADGWHQRDNLPGELTEAEGAKRIWLP
jgi:hypothetical protein